MATVEQFVRVVNCSHSRIAYIYTAKTIAFLAIMSQGHTPWRERGRTAFSGPAQVNPSGPTHVSFRALWFSIGWRERGRTGHMIIERMHSGDQRPHSFVETKESVCIKKYNKKK